MTNLQIIEQIISKIPLDEWRISGSEMVLEIEPIYIYISSNGYIRLSGSRPQDQTIHSNYAQLLYNQVRDYKKNVELTNVTNDLQEAFESYKKRKI